MNRSHSVKAIVLSLKPLGENNSSVTLLTPDKGIIYAVLYGGPKSKMRSLVAQWNSGTAYLYENQEKNQIKISDFEVINYHYSFRENLFKMYAASLAAETAVKTRCAGSSEECFALISGFFDGMELCKTEEQARLGLVRFLWRFLQLLGVQPEIKECGRCETNFFQQKFDEFAETYYNEIDNTFICAECAQENEKHFPLALDGAKYLYAVSELSPSQARKLPVSENAYRQIRQIVFHLIEKNIGQKLNSIETGVGIL